MNVRIAYQCVWHGAVARRLESSAGLQDHIDRRRRRSNPLSRVSPSKAKGNAAQSEAHAPTASLRRKGHRCDQKTSNAVEIDVGGEDGLAAAAQRVDDALRAARP